MSKRGHYGLWSEKDLLLAVAAYKNGEYGLNECSRVYKIPKATIKRHADKKNSIWNNAKVLGRPRIFSTNIEEIISEHILRLRECSFDLTVTDVGKLAFDVAENYQLPHTFNKKTKAAGKKWLHPFLKRNPHLTLGKNNRKPKTTLKRLERFFDRLEQILDEHKFTGATIYHVDKCIFTTVQKTPQKIVARKGKYQVGSISTVECGVNTSMICAVSAAGLYVPPMIIFKRKNLRPSLESGAPPGSFVTTSKTGNLNSSLFVKWLKHFQTYINCSADNKVLLLLDGRNTHSKTFHACDFAKKNGIVLLQLPSFRIRPLVLAFFGPLLKYFAEAQTQFLSSYKKDKIHQRHISKLLNEAYGKAATANVAEKAFRFSGIWPYNRHVIKKGKFVPADGVHSPGASDATFSSEDENSNDDSPQNEDKQFKKLLKEISQRAKKTLYSTNEPESSENNQQKTV